MKPLVIQFSGGRTSAFMAKFLFEHFPDREKIVLFQNTGEEHEETLKFVLECDRRWDLRVVWLEAVFHFGERKAPTHQVVGFEIASRSGEPYENMIRKYGIPFGVTGHCTKYLKIAPGNSYIKSLGLSDYEIAIGIRADEAHRINRKLAEKESLIYPLADLIKVNKKTVRNWWSEQDFDLHTPDDEGNCRWCFKKSIKTLVGIARSRPQILDFPRRMEREHGNRSPVKETVFFRGQRSANDLLALAKQSPTLFDNPEFEVESDCFCKST